MRVLCLLKKRYFQLFGRKQISYSVLFIIRFRLEVFKHISSIWYFHTAHSAPFYQTHTHFTNFMKIQKLNIYQHQRMEMNAKQKKIIMGKRKEANTK